ncbi:MAG: proline dehydrogenase family protein [Flavobacteriaceae bacterium]|nr:proline dehydrogenase family protein [Flavobacteriaceae bacterium]MCI5087557.1 proline dehydrogenase family protein [Flavobacteriaceae bacterium]CAI8198015.1 MAG: Proline dehydrogenase 2 [SAR116 cluster bacterium]
MKPFFEDTATAFAIKSDTALERAYFLFKLISKQPLVKLGTLVTNFAIKAHMPVEGLIRATVFDHFCGGISETDCIPVMEKMHEKQVFSVLDYSVEGKADQAYFDQVVTKITSLISFAKTKPYIPFVVFKPTALGAIDLYEKVGTTQQLTSKEQADWELVKNRFHSICKAAYDQNIPLLIDGEESWMQDAADALVLEMMKTYNKDQVLIYNTLQAYRWDRMDYIKNLLEQSKHDGFKVGIKLVRGAYMEKERLRAKNYGYVSPICETKQATDHNFNNILTYMIGELDHMSIFLGTHNEESSYLLLEQMEQKGISLKDPRIWFGQLYGMSDHISYNLSAKGYNVSKYLPFGPVRDVMPYLMRRAEENTSVAGQTNRELDLLSKERKRRKLG